MPAKTSLRILTDYFNVDEGKRPTREWAEEIRALSPNEREELTTGVMAITGDTLIKK